MTVWLLEAIDSKSGTRGAKIPPTISLNATSVLQNPACQQQR